MNYNHLEIEKKWQNFWKKNKTFQAKEIAKKPKYYVLDMFPYPSGAGLHVGHPLGYTATDIISRKKRHQGFNVLHPMGWDAFGLPAENYAIKTGIHPSISTKENIKNFTKQIKSLGFSYDWDREIDTTNPTYFKWTQWLFLQFYKQDLLYEEEKIMNWCVKCKVVVANEEVENGLHERCGETISRKSLKQWMFRITDFAERLLNDLDLPNLNWPDKIKAMQRNWIGRSEGSEIDFSLENSTKKIRVYTTRPDTLFGATYFVLSPEHPFVDELTTEGNFAKIEEYRVKCSAKSELERTELNKEKTGVFTGGYVVNPVNKEKIPVWIADYVMMEYGTGAIMAVPAHDERDFEFAKKYSIKIKPVVLDLKSEILDDEKRRNTRCHTKDDGLLTPRFDQIIFPKLIVVKQKFYKTKIENFVGEKIYGENSIIFQGDNIKKHIQSKNIKEIYFRISYFATVFHNLQNLVFENENTGYFVCKNSVFRVVLNKISKKKYEIKTYYKCKKLTKFYQNWKKSSENYEGYFEKNGILKNSEFLNGLKVEEAKEKMIKYLEKENLGYKKINYKLRDWIFTRQRYWGEPIPLVSDENGKIYPICENELPIKLPHTDDFYPTENGDPPLAKCKNWVEVEGAILENGEVQTENIAKLPKKYKRQKFFRETSTMPNWAGSSWYWLRFMDTNNEQEFCSKNAENYWGGVDLYVGGAEHAVLHLLYARFWHKVLYDLKLVSTKEPFKKLVNQGLIMSFAYQKKSGGLVSVDEVEKKGEKFFIIETGEEVKKVVAKMSKSLKNVVNPDDIVEEFGADTLRCYEMFMGPFDQSKVWSTEAVSGIRKWLDRVSRIFSKPQTTKKISKPLKSLLHKTIKLVSEHIDEFRFNTAISQLMILTNELTKETEISREILEKFSILLSPFTPHLAEEFWQNLGHKNSIVYEPWLEYEAKFLVEDKIKYAVQINGKVREDFEFAKDMDKNEVLSFAKNLEKIQKYLNEGKIVKEIFVPNKIVGFVVK